VPEPNYVIKQSAEVHERSRKTERFNVLRNLKNPSQWLISMTLNNEIGFTKIILFKTLV